MRAGDVLRRNTVPALVAATALLSTAAAWLYVARVVEGQQQVRFEDIASRSSAALRDRLEAYIAMLRSGRGFLETLDRDPTERAFRTFVSRLDLERHYPGIQGFGWSEVIAPHEVAAHEAEQRAAGREGYRVWPAGARAVYSAIVFLEPLDWRNQRAIGYDMLSEPVRRAAMVRARDSGEPALTGKVELVQEAGAVRVPGILIYVPVYRGLPADEDARRRALRGWVYAPFRAPDLVRSVLRELPAAVGLSVFDGEDADPAATLFATPETPGATRWLDDQIILAGRVWLIRYTAGQAFPTWWERAAPKAVLTTGLLLTLLVFWLTRDEARARLRAEQAAARAAFLADAGTRLAASLDFDRTLAEVAQLAVERFCDACAVQLLDDGATVWRVAHRDRARALRAEAELREQAPGTPEEAARDALGAAHVLAAPLTARGEPLGALVLASTDPARRFGPDDVALADDLARRAVAAIDTGRNYRRAQDALRARDEFLSIASHELKTPLTSLLLQTESLRTSARRGAEPEALLRKADVIRRNVDRLSRLVAELLDLSRLTAGRLEIDLEEVDLAALAREVVLRFEEEARRARCALVLDAPGPVVGRWDPLRLDQAITNLLSNAIKYGAGHPVEIAVRATEDGAALSVRDRGIGISAEDQQRIFERFERAVSKRNYGGFGLGLWITRQIVEALGGEVRVESAPGQGATFTLVLRGLVRTALPAAEAREAPRPSGPL